MKELNKPEQLFYVPQRVYAPLRIEEANHAFSFGLTSRSSRWKCSMKKGQSRKSRLSKT